MADFNSLSDRELRAKLQQYGIDATITATTRALFIRKLKAVIEESSNGNSHDEPVENRPSSMRRRSAAKPKSRQRNSIATIPIRDMKTDESDDADFMTTSSVKKPVKHKSPEKSTSVLNGSRDANVSHSSDHISDEELVKQLTKYNIPCPGISHSSRPILIKKLNHAIAKSRRDSKVFSPPPTQRSFSRTYDEEEDQDAEKDSPDNASHCLSKTAFLGISSTLTTPAVSKPELNFSKQHSLTMGHYSSFSPLDSKPKTTSPDTSNLFIPSPNVVVNRFVEEQEPSPYDTGSDSEAESKTVKTSGQKRNWPLPSWFRQKVQPTVQTAPVKKFSLIQSVKRKLNIVWQWQFIAVVLPLLAVMFFFILGAAYLRATYIDQQDQKETRAAAFLDPMLENTISSIERLLEKESTGRICNGNDARNVDSQALTEHLKVDMAALDLIKNTVQENPQLGIIISGDEWNVPPPRLPLWCSVKSFLWNLVVIVGFIILALGIGIIAYYYVMSTCRKRRKEEQEVYSMVEMIIDLLARHHASRMAERRPQDAFLAVTHVRDVLIPLKDRKSKLKLWNKAVQYLEENESRVRAEIQQIEGEDYRVWRWLPPSMTYGSQGTSCGVGVDHSVDEAGTGPGAASCVQRPKVWQGQAFSTGSSGVNAPPPYPLTQCLKVRNMFEAEVEIGDVWPVRIQDAVLEKAEGAKILHLAVDKASREGCVYIKCASNEDAGKVYRALHGWWFDGNLVTVKYLRPERYHYRFPDSLQANVPLQPSNDKRLSLQTKFWKSPLEHF